MEPNREKWPDIESAALDLGISERTAWRWLKSGKLIKIRDGSGEKFIVLADDNSDTDGDSDGTGDDNDVSSIDVSAMSSGMRRGRERGGKRSSSTDHIEALRSELEASKLEMELQRLEDFHIRQEERIERAKGKRLEPIRQEQERQRQAERQRLILEMERNERAAYEAKIRKIIADIRETVIDPCGDFIKPQIDEYIIPRKLLPVIYLEFDEYFRKIDIESYSMFELYKIAESLRDRIIDDYEQEQARIREEVEAKKRAELQRRKEEENRILQEQRRKREEEDKKREEENKKFQERMEELNRERNESWLSLFKAITEAKD